MNANGTNHVRLTTMNLLGLIDAGADYSKVKAAIFQMHKDVANHLRVR